MKSKWFRTLACLALIALILPMMLSLEGVAPVAPPTLAGEGGTPARAAALAEETPATLVPSAGTGSFTHSIPLELPDFRGLQPYLALNYDSLGRDDVAGTGWSLSGISTLDRLSPGRGIPTFDTTDVYELNGVPLEPCPAESAIPGCLHPVEEAPENCAAADCLHLYISRPDHHWRIARDTRANAWHIWETDGTHITLTATSVISGLPVRWQVQSVVDTLGNRVDYAYQSGPNQIGNLREISYNGVRVGFHYEARPDPLRAAAGAGILTQTQRLTTVDISILDRRQKTFALRYSHRQGSNRSFLTGVEQFGSDAELDAMGRVISGSSVPETTFSAADASDDENTISSPSQEVAWQTDAPGDTYRDSVSSSDFLSIERSSDFMGHRQFQGEELLWSEHRWLPADLNGDRRQDLILVSSKLSYAPRIGTAIARLDGTYSLREEQTPYILDELPRDIVGSLGVPWFSTDVNGDGLTDLMGVGSSALESVALVALSRGDGSFTYKKYPLPWAKVLPEIINEFTFFWSLSLAVGTHPAPLFANVDHREIAGVGVASGYFFSTPARVFMTQKWFPAELNGDGQTDLLLTTLREHGQGSSRRFSTLLCPALMGSSALRAQDCQDMGWEDDSEIASRRHFVGDTNADGFSDLIFVSRNVSDTGEEIAVVHVAQSNGDGTFTGSSQPLRKASGDEFIRWGEEDLWYPGDTNGDGRTDLMHVQKHGDGGSAVAVLESWVASPSGDIFQAGGQHRSRYGWFLPRECGAGEGISSVSEVPAIWFPGDADADGRTDLMHVYTHCSGGQPRLRTAGVSLHKLDAALFDKDSNVSWDRERPWVLDKPFSFFPADVNGDGRTDLALAVGHELVQHFRLGIPPWRWEAQPWQLRTVLTQQVRSDPGRALHADVNGDGTEDFIYPEFKSPGLQISVTPRTPDGSLDAENSVPATRVFDIVDPRPPHETHNADMTAWKAADLNRDGRADFIRMSYRWECLRNPTPGTGPPCAPRHYNENSGKAGSSRLLVEVILSDWEAPTWHLTTQEWWGYADEDTRRWRIADINGDAYPDLVKTFSPWRDGPSRVTVDIIESLGTGRFAAEIRSSQHDYSVLGSEPGTLANWLPADTNRDGRLELIHPGYLPRGGGVNAVLLIHTLASRDGGQTWDLSFTPRTVDAAAGNPAVRVPAWRITDLNGDGAADLAHLGEGMRPLVSSVMSGGRGNWSQGQTEPIRTPTGGAPSTGNVEHGHEWLVGDVNADGKSDFLHAELEANDRIVVRELLSRGDGTWSVRAETPRQVAAPLGASPGGLGWQALDATGDGTTDLVQVTLTPGGLRSVVIATAPQDDKIARIDNGRGVVIEAAYDRARQPSDGLWRAECSLPLNLNFELLARTTVSIASAGTASTRSWSLRCPHWSYERRVLMGWEKEGTISTDGDAPAASTYTENVVDESCGARPIHQEVRTLVGVEAITGGLLLGRAPPEVVLNGLDVQYLDSNQRDCSPQRLTDFVCNMTPQCIRSSTEIAYDEFGNVVRIEESSGSATRLIERQFVRNVGRYIVAAMGRERIMDSTGALLSDTRYCYDDAPGGSDCSPTVTDGLLTDVFAYDDAREEFNHTARFHDRDGNVVEVVDANGHRTRYSYDTDRNLLPVEVCNHLCIVGQNPPEKLQWGAGQELETSVDANGIKVWYTYDVFGRLSGTSTSASNGPAISFTHRENADSAGNSHGTILRTVQADGTADGLWSEEVYDGLGRLVSERQESDEIQTADRRDLTYMGAASLVSSVSEWYRDGDLPNSYESFQYDAAGRKVRQVHVDGTALSWEYGTAPEAGPSSGTGRTVIIARDERGYRQDLLQDGLGRLVQVREYIDGRQLDTTYVYDAANRLVAASDADGNTTSLAWSSTDSLTQVDDPDTGRWQVQYDRVGNMTSLSDAAGLTTDFAYDALNRLVTKELRGFSGTTTRWFYDENTPAHGAGIGRLTSVSAPSAEGCAFGVGAATAGFRISQALQYDGNGRVTSDSRCVLGMTQTHAWTFDKAGREVSMRYPTGETIAKTYGPSGRLQSITSVIESMSYDPAGRPLGIEYANGVKSRFSYASRGWLSSVSTTSRTGDQVVGIAFDRNETTLLAATRHSPDGISETYNYDALGRLTAAASGNLVVNYRYDDVGNMTFNSELGTYVYRDATPPASAHGCTAQSGPHQVQEIDGECYEYAANGNVARRGNSRLEWDNNSRPTWIRDPMFGPAGWTRFIYDADGELAYRGRSLLGPTDRNRFGQVDRAAWTFIAGQRFYGPWTRTSLGSRLESYQFEGRTIAQNRGGERTFYHVDDRNNAFATSDQSGRLLPATRTSPYGAPTSRAGAPRDVLGFGGYRQEEPAGLLDAGARMFDPRVARFLSPDTAPLQLSNPQSLNPYTFGFNNPGSHTDPDGEQACGAGQTEACVLMVVPPEKPPPPAARSRGAGPGTPNDVSVDCTHCSLIAPPEPPEDSLTLGQAIDAGYIREGRVSGLTAAGLPAQPDPFYDNTGETMFGAFAELASLALGGVGVSGGAAAAGAIFKGSKVVGAASGPVGTTAAVKATGQAQVQINRLVGNAFESKLASAYRSAGFSVRQQVHYWTPFKARYVDIEISYQGKVIQLIEAKAGMSRYHVWQRIKDAYIWQNRRLWTDVVREEALR